MFKWLISYFASGISGKVFTIVGSIVVVAWISLTIFLWDSLGNKTEEVGRLEATISSVADTNDELNNTIDTILLDKAKTEKILSEKNKANIKLLEESNTRKGVIINEEDDSCLDKRIPDSIRNSLFND